MRTWKKIQLWILIVFCLLITVFIFINASAFTDARKGLILWFLLVIAPTGFLYARFYKYKPGRKQLEEMIGGQSYKAVEKGIKGAKVANNIIKIVFNSLILIVLIISVVYALFNNKSCSGSDASGETKTKIQSVKNSEAQEWFDKAYNSTDYNYQVSCYTKCLSFDREYTLAYNNRGVAYQNLGRYQEAIDDYNTTIKINPDYSDAYYNRGVTYQTLGRYQDAIRDYTRALSIDPDYALAYVNRGIAKEQLGIDDCSDYKKACELGNTMGCEYYKMDGCN